MKKFGAYAAALAMVCAFAFAISGFTTTAAQTASNGNDTVQVATMVSDMYLTDYSPLSHFERRQAVNFRATSNNLRMDGTKFKQMKSLRTVAPK